MIWQPDKKYEIIYADPPWHFNRWGKRPDPTGRSTECKYPTMSAVGIGGIPVQDLAAPDCALFLWATFPNLQDALFVLKAWGFTYKTVAFTWVKTTGKGLWHLGLGYWTRANPEICLLATRGHPKRLAKDVRNLIVATLREHSRKPDEARERIVRLMGDKPRIELFARQAMDGWDTWGNQCPCSVELMEAAHDQPQC